jgi:hypothetical protein
LASKDDGPWEQVEASLTELVKAKERLDWQRSLPRDHAGRIGAEEALEQARSRFNEAAARRLEALGD